MGQRRANPPVGARPRGAAAILVAALFVGTPTAASDLEQVEALAGEGALELAVALIDRHQPAREGDAGVWRRWESRRLALLERRKAWTALITRVEGYPENDLDPDFRRQADDYLARALIRLDRGEALADLAFRRLWQGAPPASDEVTTWQRRLVTAWRLAGQPAAALATLQRLRRPPTSGPDQRAALLLELDQPVAALRALDEAEAAAPALRLLAELRAGRREAAEVATAAGSAATEAESREAARLRLLHAHVTEDPAQRAAALARLLALGPEVELPGIPAATADDLWAAWRDQGRVVANRRGLLFGDHEAWMAAADESTAREKRALLASLAREAASGEVRAEAHRRLAIALLEANDGRLLERLYTEASAFGDAAAIPRPIRYTLADRFVDAGRLAPAARLFRGLEPPSRGDSTPWRLRQARVLVLAGEVEAGASALHALLDQAPALEPETLDRALQVAFDLQGAGGHVQALALFERLYRRARTPQTEREIRFWMGESYREQEDYAAAAAAYLRAARHIPDDLDDPWVETAYYRAARSLARGGFTADARALYQRLLKATEGTRREALLRNELRRLSREGENGEGQRREE